MATATHIRAYSSSRELLGLLPDHRNLMVQHEHNETGVLSFEYMSSGMNASLLDRDTAYLAVVEGGVEDPAWFRLDDDEENLVDAHGINRAIKASARGLLCELESAIVYPKGHQPGGSVNGLEAKFDFTDATPGAVIGTLIDRAKARGALVGIGYSFTSTHDSVGVAWPTKNSVTYAAGMDLLKVVLAACDNGWCDARMTGFNLALYVPDTAMGVDRPGVILRTAQNVQSGPRKRSRRGIVSHMLGVGAEKHIVEVSDASAVQKWGRREGFASDGRMTTDGSLLSMTTTQLGTQTDAKEGFTLSLSLDEPAGERWPRPGRDFNLGDRIRWEERRLSPTELEPLRVRSISYGWSSPDSPRQCEIELNDLFVESSIRLERRVAGIVNGSTTNAPVPEYTPDTVAPAAVASIALEPDLYVDKDRFRACVAVTWPAVAVNVDGTAYADHARYEVSHRIGSAQWTGATSVQTTATWIDNLPPGGVLEVRVRAVDTTANASEWKSSGSLTLPVDAVPPPVASLPTLTSELGTMTVAWNGRAFDGSAMPFDFSHVEIHVMTDPYQGLDSVTLRDNLRGAGTRVIADLEYDTAYWVRLVAHDAQGNRAKPTEPVEGGVRRLVDTDLIGQVIDGANIIDGTLVASEKVVAESITGREIQALTIETDHLKANSITAPKVVAGAIKAQHLGFGAVSTNLLSNPGFEDTGAPVPMPGEHAQVPGWFLTKGTHSGTSTASFRIDETSTNLGAARGRGFVVLGNGGLGVEGWNLYSQPFPVTAGDTYALSARLGGRTASAVRSTFLVEWMDDTSGLTYEVVPTPAMTKSYVTAAAQVVAPARATQARIRIRNDGVASPTAGANTYLQVDDVAMFAIGAGAVEITAGGIRMWDEEGAESINLSSVGEAANFATFGGGRASISETGNVSGTVLSANNALYYQGTELTTLLNKGPRGQIAWSSPGPTAISGVSAAAGRVGLCDLSFTAEAGRTYKVTVEAQYALSAADGACALVIHDAGPDPVSIHSPVLKSRAFSGQVPGYSQNAELTYNGSSWTPGVHRLLLSAQEATGLPGTLTLFDGANIVVEDMGPTVPGTGSVNRGGGTTQAPPPPVTTYDQQFGARWARSFWPNGSHYVNAGSKMYQGYYSSVSGDHSMAGFDDLTGLLSGATIHLVHVYFNFHHWYNNAGGTARIGVHGYYDAPGSMASGSGSSHITDSGGWPKPGARWVDITSTASGWKSGAYRGVSLDRYGSTSKEYYGYADPPILRIQYTK